MRFPELINRPDISSNNKLERSYLHFKSLIDELETKSLTENSRKVIADEISLLNDTADNKLLSQIRKSTLRITRIVEKESKLVPKGYYRMLWTGLGMSAFGIPIGVAFGAALKNMGLIGIGLPIGLGIGVAYGTTIDKKAAKEGRQLNWEMGKS
ncbi:hypothetical protein [Polluticaenibacter yanchengensis]|uniref:Glycine zipper family protein n=1 Tax=Polluticaenibacter yanchengensis TaxID=3014562 RepID=A0ABT4UG91_9BACT|nr:hypothetical protein [Chitinophagaceae bacterium LY-5]